MADNTINSLSNIEKNCLGKGIKLTGARRLIAQILSESNDHPDVEMVLQRVQQLDAKIGMATVYRTVKLFEEANIIARHDFRDGRSRYEEMPDIHHDHLIDVRSGGIIEFHNQEIEDLQQKVAEKLGYQLIGHRLELYAIPLKKK